MRPERWNKAFSLLKIADRHKRSCPIPAILRLRLAPLNDVRLHAKNGPAQGWFLALVRAWDPAWSAALHGGSRRTPYALSPLHRASATPLAEEDQVNMALYCGGSVCTGEEISLRVSLADEERARRFLAELPSLPLPLLGGVPCRLVRCPRPNALDPDWLSASWATLADAPPASRLHVSFETPTAFSHQGEFLLLPDPAHLVASWRGAWDHAPARPAGADILTLDGLRVTSYDLHTEALPLKGGLRIGFVGEIELTWRPGTPPETRRTLAALAGLADFLGTGAKTALGMGQTRVRIWD